MKSSKYKNLDDMEQLDLDDSRQGLMDDELPISKSQVHGRRRQVTRQQSKWVKFSVVFTLPCIVIIALLIVVSTNTTEPSKSASTAAPTGFEYPTGFDMKKNWGTYSPYFEGGAPYNDIKADEPNENGHLHAYKQLHILHRHGDRYPTGSIEKKMLRFVKKLDKMTESPHKSIQWITDWNYTLGRDLLVMKGVATEFASGARFWSTHGRILFNAEDKLQYTEALNADEDGAKRPPIVLRSTDQSRIETSARAWAAGFFGFYGGQPDSPKDTDNIYELILQREEKGYNSTLASYMSCEQQTDRPGKKNELAWINKYMSDAAQRLQKLLPGIEDLDAVDAFAMQALCTFEYAAQGFSPFCGLFTEKEWRGFEYAQDLKFYGEASFGSKTGAAEGAGWLMELASRLSGKYPETPSHGINITENHLVPLNQKFYMDMTHDAIIISVLTAMGLDFLKPELPNDRIPVPRQFVMSRLAPFGANLIVEVLQDDLVRVKLNSRILPLHSLEHCPENEHGICALDKFIDSIEERLAQIDFDDICAAR